MFSGLYRDPCKPKRSPHSKMTCSASANAVFSLLPVPRRKRATRHWIAPQDPLTTTAHAANVHSFMNLSGTRGARFESIQLALVEVVDGIAYCLLSAPQVEEGAS